MALRAPSSNEAPHRRDMFASPTVSVFRTWGGAGRNSWLTGKDDAPLALQEGRECAGDASAQFGLEATSLGAAGSASIG